MKVINDNGEERSFTYNANGKVTKVVDYDGSSITKEYNEINKTSKIVDAFGNKTLYEYDVMWNVKKEVLANGGETLYGFIDNIGRYFKLVYPPNEIIYLWRSGREGATDNEIIQ